MIAIIADDFSGAAELAGIAAARGFKAEVQTVFEAASDAEVIAVDTDTRLKSESEAVHIVREISRQIMAAKPKWIYKKTDSVLRGHVRAEIEAILEVTGFAKCVLIPANPSKGRIIRDGRYFIEGVPLDETLFASDPDYPRHSANVRELLGHAPRIVTPDATSLDDLAQSFDAQSLAAGASDFFQSRFDFSRRVSGDDRLNPPPPSASLLLCGSLAAWDTGRAEQMRRRGFVVKTIAEDISPSLWQTTSRLMLAIGRPPHNDTLALIEKLIDAAFPLVENSTDMRIGLEGGATAIAFIRRMGWSRFEVLPEGHTGVGTLRPPGGPVLWVKPGSYLWPETLF